MMLSNSLALKASQGAWTPARLGSSLWLWLRGDQYSAATGNWTDLGAGGRSLSQGTAANRPAATTLNGLAALDFDGTNDLLDSADLDASPLAQAYTFFAVCKDDPGTDGSRTLVDTSSALSANRMTILQPANIAVVSGATFVTGSNIGTAPHVLELVVNGASSKFRLDGGTEATGNAGANTWGQVRVGSNSVGDAGTFWDGVIAEIVVASGELDAATRANVRRYLGRRYAITVA